MSHRGWFDYSTDRWAYDPHGRNLFETTLTNIKTIHSSSPSSDMKSWSTAGSIAGTLADADRSSDKANVITRRLSRLPHRHEELVHCGRDSWNPSRRRSFVR
ncbi:hypothetical protein J6590_027514 [Homalodisca vitripennis]|nr:hypothetical protein J6590_027514 [Homalodisca vitripennis]